MGCLRGMQAPPASTRMEVPMTAPENANERTVYVRSYLRLKNGKWQEVTCHYRRPRRKRGELY